MSTCGLSHCDFCTPILLQRLGQVPHHSYLERKSEQIKTERQGQRPTSQQTGSDVQNQMYTDCQATYIGETGRNLKTRQD